MNQDNGINGMYRQVRHSSRSFTCDRDLVGKSPFTHSTDFEYGGRSQQSAMNAEYILYTAMCRQAQIVPILLP